MTRQKNKKQQKNNQSSTEQPPKMPSLNQEVQVLQQTDPKNGVDKISNDC